MGEEREIEHGKIKNSEVCCFYHKAHKVNLEYTNGCLSPHLLVVATTHAVRGGSLQQQEHNSYYVK